jgi:PhnB protein
LAQTATHIPAGHHAVTPYLIVKDVEGLIGFLKKTFDAEEVMRSLAPDGDIRHAEVRIGDSVVMMGGASDEWRAMPAALYVYVEDVDASYRRALEAGGTSLGEPDDKEYGDRNAGVRDPSGNFWWISTPVTARQPG